MPNYDSTARVPFKHGGSVKKPKVKRIILWKGKAKDWPGAKKAAEQLRNKKAEGGRIGLKHGGKGKGFTSKWITPPGKRRRMDKKPSTGTGRKKINPQWLEEKYNVELKADGGRMEYAGGTDFKKWLQGKQKFEKKRTREQLHREYLEDKRRQKVAEQKQNVADGGIIDFKHGGKVRRKPKTREKSKQKHRGSNIAKPEWSLNKWGLKHGGKVKEKTRKEKQADYIKKHGERPPRRKTLAVTDKYKKIRDSLGLKKGGKADKKWIQKATKGMRKDKPCTGKKFGSATCPPGSKRYNLAKTFKKMARSKHASGDMVRYI